jgi:hypothetical protein
LIAAPPLLDGASHVSFTRVLPAVAAADRGAVGVLAAATAYLASLAAAGAGWAAVVAPRITAMAETTGAMARSTRLLKFISCLCVRRMSGWHPLLER